PFRTREMVAAETPVRSASCRTFTPMTPPCNNKWFYCYIAMIIPVLRSVNFFIRRACHGPEGRRHSIRCPRSGGYGALQAGSGEKRKRLPHGCGRETHKENEACTLEPD